MSFQDRFNIVPPCLRADVAVSANLSCINESILYWISLLLIVVGISAFIYLIIAGIKMATSGGDAAKITAAKSTITHALIGIAIAVLAFTIVNFFLSLLGSPTRVTPGGITDVKDLPAPADTTGGKASAKLYLVSLSQADYDKYNSAISEDDLGLVGSNGTEASESETQQLTNDRPYSGLFLASDTDFNASIGFTQAKKSIVNGKYVAKFVADNHFFENAVLKITQTGKEPVIVRITGP